MLNETNITIDAARVMINSQTGTNDSLALISQILIPAIAIIATGVTSVLITYYTVTNNTRSIYIQANQTEIKKAMEELSKRVDRGQSQEILDFLNSIKGIYIPKSMRNRIRKKCSGNWLLDILLKRKAEIGKEQKIKIIDEINKYISP
ncbi:MAG: hypothetical protein PHU34_11615 [Candidatus Methanoperedens sp.]|nr:hypothetical protein [Candidatus Methanoperedens sp.]